MNPATDIPVQIVSTEKGGHIHLKVGVARYEEMKRWIAEWRKREEGAILVTFRVPTAQRSLSQNALHWPLASIICYETTGTFEKDQVELVHDGILERYAERYGTWVINPLTGKRQARRSHKFSKPEFTQLIEMDFAILSEIGVHSVENGEQVRGYFLEWQNWRGKQKVDPLTHASLAEYDERVPYCEACLCPLAKGEGQLAHIVSAGAGGDTRPVTEEDVEDRQRVWNRVKLCSRDHIFLDHQNGDEELIGNYPHLAYRVNRARKRFGLRPVRIGARSLYAGLIGIGGEDGEPEASEEVEGGHRRASEQVSELRREGLVDQDVRGEADAGE